MTQPGQTAQKEPTPDQGAKAVPEADVRKSEAASDEKKPETLATAASDTSEGAASDTEDARRGRVSPQAAKAAQARADKEAQKREEQSRQVRRFRRIKIVSIVVGIILALLLAAFGLFTWNRWYRFDDAADLQGEWYVAGTDVAITIDDSAIRLDDKTSYRYSIDDNVKTITYGLGNLEGQGHYWFSADRNYLVITDGEEFSKWGTAFGDLGHDIAVFFTTLTGGEMELPSGDGIIALSRTPNSGKVAPDSSASSGAASSSASSDSASSGSSEPSDGSSSSSSSPKDIFAEVSDHKIESESAQAAGQEGEEPAVQYEEPAPQNEEPAQNSGESAQNAAE